MLGLKGDTGAIVCACKIVEDDAEALLFTIVGLSGLLSMRHILEPSVLLRLRLTLQ